MPPGLVPPVLKYVLSDAAKTGPWDAQMVDELHDLTLLLYNLSDMQLSASAHGIALLQTSGSRRKLWLCAQLEIQAFLDLLPEGVDYMTVESRDSKYVENIERCLEAGVQRNVKVGP